MKDQPMNQVNLVRKFAEKRPGILTQSSWMGLTSGKYGDEGSTQTAWPFQRSDLGPTDVHRMETVAKLGFEADLFPHVVCSDRDEKYDWRLHAP
jgi:hypothetical protein